MILYNGQLKILYDMMCRKEHLRIKYEELLKQRFLLQEEANELQNDCIKEQTEVKSHEYGGLAAFFLNVVLKMDKKLNEEKEKAYAATIKYDATQRLLQKVEEEIASMEKEMLTLQGCEEEYEQLLYLKKERMKSMKHESVEKVLELDQKLTYLDNQMIEVDEAIKTGKDALDVTKKVLEVLGNADQCGICNFVQGGFITDMFVYSKLIDAQCLVEKLQHHLRRFKTELSNIAFDEDLQVSVDDFLWFSDDFFENLLTDWSGLLKGKKPREQVQDTKTQIENLLNSLVSMKTQVVERRRTAHMQLEELIVQVNI